MIGQWAADAGPEVLAVLGATRGPAQESTFRRAFALVSPDVLDRVLVAWLWTARAGGRLVARGDLITRGSYKWLRPARSFAIDRYRRRWQHQPLPHRTAEWEELNARE